MGRRAYSDEEVQKARQALTQAAMALYLELGLDGVSLRQVAERAGLSHTLVYRYFDDKEALLAELRLLCLDDFELALRHADRPKADPVARVRAVLMGVLAFGCDQPAKYRLVFAHSQPDLSAFPRLLAKRCEIFDSCVDLVQTAIDHGNLDVDALAVTHGLWSLLHGMLSLQTAGQLVHGMTLRQMTGPVLDAALLALNPVTLSALKTRARRRTTDPVRTRFA